MTLKQKAVAKKILENPSLPLGRAMREVGYSENSAIAPEKNLTSSKGWQELMDKYLPDDKVLAVHQEALEATKVVSARIVGKDADSQTDDFIDVPDHQTRLKATELAYKVKGKLNNNPTALVQQNFYPEASKKADQFMSAVEENETTD